MRFTSEPSSQAFTWEGMCFQNITWYLANSRSRLNQRCEPGFQRAHPHVADLQRQLEVGRDRSRPGRQKVAWRLPQVENRLVVAEQHRPQVGMAVEPEAADDRALEVAHEPVSEEERPRALVHDSLEQRLAGEHLVAVRALHASGAELVEHRVKPSGSSTVAIHDDEPVVAGLELAELRAQLGDDAVGIEMQVCGQAVDVDVPAAPVGDLLHLGSKCSTHDQGGSAVPTRPFGPTSPQVGMCRPHDTASSSGNASTSTKVSLKSVRPESSTYSRRAGSSNATWRSRYDSSAIFAPSPAELPTAMMRSTSTGGTRPMTFALSGLR